MPYREITLTSRLIEQKKGKVRRTYNDIILKSRHSLNFSYVKEIEKIINTGKIYCGVCGEPIDEEYIGKKIISRKNHPRHLKNWFHVECAKEKNMI